METTKLGQLAPEGAARDAVHVAAYPAVAGEELWPGWPIEYDGKVARRADGPGIGVVDPFLQSSVPEGARFWLCLYPGTVTSLRHAWTHPAFAAKGVPNG